MQDQQFDVAVVGLGPAGMTAAALLGRSGRRVVALDRYSGPYHLPRAATFDDETMRTFAHLGIADELLPVVHHQPTYEWRNGEGDLLIEYEYAARGWSGWAEWYQMHQPDVEAALLRACERSGVEVRYGTTVTGYDQDAHGVTVRTDAGTVRASYVVAADGGNGISREAIGAELTDLGFDEPWMVCDFRYDENPGVPMARQVGDPAQPTSIIGLGPHHHRFSFMLDSVDDFDHESSPEKVWARVAPYLRPDQAELIRVATYTFRSLLAHPWREGRVFLAGDAAHQMPPFLGQGMCSGIRDARNLAFKLDIALDSVPDVVPDEPGGAELEALLDTYESERLPHVTAITRKGIELGRFQTIRDPRAAAERDAKLIADRLSRRAPQKLRFPDLADGLLAREPRPGRGALMPQGRLSRDGAPTRFDDVVRPGFQLVVRAGAATDPGLRRRAEEALDAVVAVDAATDVDDVYLPWLDEHGAVAVLVRPDGYVFGTAADAGQIDGLVAEVDAIRTPQNASPQSTSPQTGALR